MLDRGAELAAQGKSQEEITDILNKQFEGVSLTFEGVRKRLKREGVITHNHQYYHPIPLALKGKTHVEEILNDQDVDLSQYEVTSLRVSNWDAQVKGQGVQQLRSTQVFVKPRGSADEQAAQLFLDNLRALASTPLEARTVPDITYQGDHMVVAFSDLHVGKEATYATTGANFVYNSQVAKDRWRVWLDRVKAIALVRQPECIVLACAGDLAEGSQMRDSQGFRIDCTVGEQSMIVTDILVQTIRELKECANGVWVILVGGNHGRIGERGQGLQHDNVEIIVGHSLTHVFANDPEVKIEIVTTPEIVVEIAGKNVLIAHGDKVTNHSEIAHWEYLRKQEDAWSCHIDIFLSAHWHCISEYHDQNRVCIGNGGFDNGACDFARNQIVKQQRAEQIVFGLRQEDFGISWREIVPVAEVRAPRLVKTYNTP